MSYDIDQFCHSGGTSRAPRYHTYHTTDNKATVTATGYFNIEHVRLRVNDIITIVNTNDVYDVVVKAVSKNFVEVELEALIRIGFVEYHLPSSALPLAVALDDDGVTFSVIPGFAVEAANRFQLSGNDLLYTGIGGNFLFNGTSDLQSNKVSDITYSLYLNGSPVTDEQTTFSFTSANKKANISITGILSLVTNDVLAVRAKSDGTVGTIITINKLDTTLVGL